MSANPKHDLQELVTKFIALYVDEEVIRECYEEMYDKLWYIVDCGIENAKHCPDCGEEMLICCTSDKCATEEW